MTVNVRCSSQYRVDPREQVDPKDLAAWLTGLPDGVELVALTHQVGSQRDPVEKFVGIAATWTEER